MASEIVDIYPSHEKFVPPNYTGDVKFLNGLISFIIYYWTRLFRWKNRFLHFNFSTAKSGLIFFALPKAGAKFSLMLHHGDLNSRTPLLSRAALSRIDYLFCMTENQELFYKSIGIPERKILRVSSYIPPTTEPLNKSKQDQIDSFFNASKVLIASGYPTKIYNHDWCIRFVKNNPEFKLGIFIYGSGSELNKLIDSASSCDRIKIFQDHNQSEFNYALSKSLIYLRPTSKDSFGIAVADAINLGVKALASDVCQRYPGTHIFNPGKYEDFCLALESVISDKNIKIESDAGFIEFYYPDF